VTLLPHHPVRREIVDDEQKAKRLARMLELEDEIYQTAAGVLKAHLDFHLVTPDQVDPPPEWVEELGEKAARQRLAVAKSGWMPPSLAPAAIKTAGLTFAGISRARRQQAGALGPATLNVQLQLPAPTAAGMPGAPQYPKKEIGE
jgi:hypothetical protein